MQAGVNANLQVLNEACSCEDKQDSLEGANEVPVESMDVTSGTEDGEEMVICRKKVITIGRIG